MLLLAFDGLRIAGINRRRAAKIARVREYGRNIYKKLGTKIIRDRSGSPIIVLLLL